MTEHDGETLVLRAGFGLAKGQEELLQRFELQAEDRKTPGILASVVRDKKPFLINSLSEGRHLLSAKDRLLLRLLAVRSLLCVPLVYEQESLGVLVVDKGESVERLLTQSDINLLQGVASQTAASIVNARSFRKIRESEAIHRTLIETVADIVFMLDARNCFTFVSPIVKALAGYRADELLGRNFSDFFIPHEGPGLVAVTQEVELERIMTGRFQLQIKDGERSIPFEVKVAPLFTGGSDAIRLIGVARDISQRVREDLLRQELEIKAVGQAKLASLGEISTGIAHEINQPLSYIQLIYQVALRDLEEGNLDHDELREDFAEALRQVSRIVRIIDHLRVFGRSDSLVCDEEVRLGMVLENTMILMRERIRLRNISLEIEVAEELPLVFGNSSRLEQVVINLLQNSIDALQGRDDGRIRISVVAQGSRVVFRLVDNGNGIAPEHLEKIFEPFFTTKEVGRGTGVGLAIVYGIIKEHQGEISCCSNPAEGTEFIISLPGLPV